MVFKDRTDAGRQLADALAPVISGRSAVAGIPRGGVVVAAPIAQRLGAPLMVACARKLTAPFAPELAFGALDEDGRAITDPGTVAMLGLEPAHIEEAKDRVGREIRRRMALYRVRPLGDHLPGRSVVLVDDGLATGLTMRAAVAYARRHGAREITVAAPCASTETAERFEREADRFVGLVVDPEFSAVGAYYQDFSQVSDDEVLAILARAAPAPAGLRVSFKNPRGLRLAGELMLPEGVGPFPTVVFAHGWGSGKASPRNRAVAEAVLERGFASFLFDFTGHGESEGEPGAGTPAAQAEDLRAALDVVESLDDVDPHRLGVAGASSGAAVAVLVAAGDARVRALALRSPNLEGAERAVPRVTVPTLLVVGERDAPIRAMCEAKARHFGGVSELAVVPGGDHLFEDPAALRRAVEIMARWLEERLR